MYFIILAFSPEVRNRIQGKTSWLFIFNTGLKIDWFAKQWNVSAQPIGSGNERFFEVFQVSQPPRFIENVFLLFWTSEVQFWNNYFQQMGLHFPGGLRIKTFLSLGVNIDYSRHKINQVILWTRGRHWSVLQWIILRTVLWTWSDHESSQQHNSIDVRSHFSTSSKRATPLPSFGNRRSLLPIKGFGWPVL